MYVHVCVRACLSGSDGGQLCPLYMCSLCVLYNIIKSPCYQAGLSLLMF